MLTLILSLGFIAALYIGFNYFFSNASSSTFQHNITPGIQTRESGQEESFTAFTPPTDAWKNVDLDTEEYGTPLGI